MKLMTGFLIGMVGAAVWVLSEPDGGGPADLSSRITRLRAEWDSAVSQGKVAGEARRLQMQQEFEAVFQK